MSTVGHYQSNEDDFEAITRIFDTHSLLQCPLCKKDFQDPRILCSNGHTFCVQCIQSILPGNGLLKCPTCKETRRFASLQEVNQLTKNHTLQTLKRAEHHRIAQIGVCELCNKKAAYGRCFHCRQLACFKCMEEHERTLADENAKEYEELVKIRDNLMEKMTQWDKTLTETREQIRKNIQIDVNKQMKEISEREQMLYDQLDDLYQTYLTAKNTKLQKIKLDLEKESNDLNRIDPKEWSSSERLRLSQYWHEIQRKINDQSIDFFYQPTSSSMNPSHLGELHLKLPNHDVHHSTEDLRESKMKTHKRLIITERSVQPPPNETLDHTHRSATATVKFSTRNHSRQEGQDYAIRKVFHSRQQIHEPSLMNMKLPDDFDQPIEDNTPLTPRRPIAPIRLGDYSKKATHILTGPNENDKFLAPKAIAITENNQLLIADTKKHRILIYDLNQRTMKSIKGFLFPDGLCLAAEHYVIITDRHRVSKYDWLNGKMISFIGSKKEGCTRTTFSWPKGVTIDKNFIFVCDSYNSRMVVLTHQMKYENEWIVIRGKKKRTITSPCFVT